jgi:rod shape-determining protein MreC
MAKGFRGVWERVRVFVVLMAVSAFLFLMPRSFTAPARVLLDETVGPIQTGVYQGSGELLARTGTVSEMYARRDREAALARQVRTLRNEAAALSYEAARRQQALDSIAELEVASLPVRAVRAPVSAYDASAVRRSISVRAGTRDGVAKGMAATSDGALVGVVMEAGPNHCRVRLITDPASAVPCRPATVRGLCILQGTGGPKCRAEWVDRDTFLEADDVLVTSSLQTTEASSLRIPDGVPAATVLSVTPDRMRPLFAEVVATPRTDLERLEAVEVLVPVQ